MYRIWIISLSENRVIFTRFWPHLEKRDGFYFPHVSQGEFLRILYNSLGIASSQNSTTPQKERYGGKERRGTLSSVPELDYVSMRSTTTLNTTQGVLSRTDSTGSNDSLNSLMSTNTIASNASSMRNVQVDASEFDDDFISVPNFLPIITCRFLTSPRENLEHPEHHRSPYIDLSLVVYEARGHLFVACPQFSLKFSSRHNHRGLQNFEELFLEEQNFSLSYSSLQALSAYYFDNGRSLKSLEFFITNNMPFGTLLNNLRKPQESHRESHGNKNSDSPKQPPFLHVIVNEYLSTSLLSDSETVFGTLDIVPNMKLIEPAPTADLKIVVENLDRFNLARPFNCDTTNTGLLFNLKKSKMNPFGLLHYRTESQEAQEKTNSPASRKLFTYRFTVTKKTGSSSNLHHLQLVIGFNPRIICDDLKFAFFIIKFSLSKQQSKVQTATSSFVNLLVRESIKLSGGQVRNEQNTCTWSIAKISKGGRYSLDLDILLTPESLQNLDASVSFRLDNRFQTRFSDSSKEANLHFQSRKLQPEMFLSTASLSGNIPGKGPLAVLLDYRLQSFEYRLTPKNLEN